MDSGGPMGQDDSGFFAAEREREAGRIINEQKAQLDRLVDRIHSLEDQLKTSQEAAIIWEMAYQDEHKLRTKRRSFLDRIIGYIG